MAGNFNLGTASGRIEIDTSGLSNLAVSAHQAGLSLVALGTAALAGFGLAVKEAAQFEKSLDHLSAVTNAPKEDIKKIGDLALQMGRTTVFSANEAAGAFVELGKAGFSVTEILSGIGSAAATLAAAGDLPLTESAEILANTIRTFNLEASDATMVADQLAGAANASTIEVQDLAVSLRYVGGVASAMKIPLDQVSQALAILGNNGIRGSTAGTSLRRILLELNPATKKQTEALKDLGIVTGSQTQLDIESGQAAEDLADITADVTTAEEKLIDARLKAKTTNRDFQHSLEKLQHLREQAPVDLQKVADAEREVRRLTIQSTQASADLVEQEEKLKKLREGPDAETVSDAERDIRESRLSVKESIEDITEAEGDLAEARATGNVSKIVKAENRLESARLGNESAMDQLEDREKDLEDLRAESLPGSKKMVEAEEELFKSKEEQKDRVNELSKAYGKAREAREGDLELAHEITDAEIDYEVAQRAAESAVRNVAAVTEELGAAKKLLNTASELQKNLFFDEQGNARSLSSIFQILQEKTANLNQAEKTRVLDMIFGSRAVAAALILMEEGSSGFAAIEAQIEESTAAEVAAERLDNLAGAFQRLKNTFKTTLIGEGSPFQKSLQSVLEFITKLILKFGELPASAQTAVGSAVAIIGGLAVTAGTFLLMIGTLARVTKAFRALKVMMIGTNTAKLALDKNVPVLGGLFGGLRKATLLLLSPLKLLYSIFIAAVTAIAAFFGVSVGVVIAVLALIAILVILIVKVKAVREFFIEAGKAIGRFFADLPEKAGKAVDEVEKFFRKLPGRIGGFIGEVIEHVKKLPGEVIKIAAEIGRALEKAGGAVLEFFSELPVKVAHGLGFVLGTVVEWGIKLAAAGLEAAGSFVLSILNFFQDLPGRIVGFLDFIIDKVVEWGPKFARKGLDAAIDFTQFIFNELLSLPGKVGGIITDIIAKLIEKVPEWGKAGLSFAKELLKNMLNMLLKLPGAIIDFLKDIVGRGISFIKGLFDKGKAAAEGFVDGFIEGLDPGSPYKPEREMIALLDNISTLVDQYGDELSRIDQMNASFKPALSLVTPGLNQVASFTAAQQSAEAAAASSSKIIEYNQTVNPSAKMDEIDLADAAIRRFGFKVPA